MPVECINNTPSQPPPANIASPSFGSDVAATPFRATLRLAVSAAKGGGGCAAALLKLQHAWTSLAAAAEMHCAARVWRLSCGLCGMLSLCLNSPQLTLRMVRLLKPQRAAAARANLALPEALLPIASGCARTCFYTERACSAATCASNGHISKRLSLPMGPRTAALRHALCFLLPLKN